jgi:hypothetical protein
MVMLKFGLGDPVYYSKFERAEFKIPCPDCGGTKKIQVTLHSGESWMIECGGCDPGGYSGPQGYITQTKFAEGCGQGVIEKIEINSDTKVSYNVRSGGDSYCFKEDELFHTSEEALEFSSVLTAEHTKKTNENFLRKTRDEKSWAWNLTYHRQRILQAEKDIEYSRKKIEVCKSHVKEEKGAK